MKTKPEEFKKFHNLLIQNSPEKYIPWYFPVLQLNKAPDGIAISRLAPKELKEKRGNWKADWARLTFEQAYKRLKEGKNIGLAARSYDPLIIIDIDDWNYINQAPNTLINLSRKRCGIHAFCFKKPECKKLPLNIPTEFGEVRSSDQYVVAAGSYCITSENDILKEPITDEHKIKILSDKNLGNYTIFKENKIKYICYNDLPEIFKNKKNEVDKFEREKPKIKNKEINFNNNKTSNLFKLTINNIISIHDKNRHPHPLHNSDTGMNFCISNGLGHCWRHNVSLNAIQFLVVKSGYMSCEDAGTGHKGSGAGSSRVVNDDGAIFHAWLEARKCGILSEDDQIPVRAMMYIARKNKLIPEEYDHYILPIKVYNKVIEIVEGEY